MPVSAVDPKLSGLCKFGQNTPPTLIREDSTNSARARQSLPEVTDQARLSLLAPKIQAAMQGMDGDDGSVLDSLSANITALQDGFVDALYQVLNKANIDLSQKMTLRLDSQNALAVSGDHPDKERVNSLLNANPDLSRAFDEIASQSELVRDISNINNLVTRQTGFAAYSCSARTSSHDLYQMSLKGDMNHFYFTR